MKNELLLDIVLLILNLFSFAFGLILGRLWITSSVYSSVEKPKSFLQKNNESNKEKVSIDDKKIVLDIKTGGMEKKYENLGEVKQSSDTISSSVDKLKQLKKG
ncbi:MAG: hypothetical protein EBS93_07605 [Chitinophagia bacterium]|nr:hypothetical protein [Chitinophagia bacterium]NCA30565.1 hypothetical protein [Chitinophagia bacterium]